MAGEGPNPYNNLLEDLQVGNSSFKYYNLPALQDERYDRLPFSIRVLLESAVRNCDNFQVKTENVESILDWEKSTNDPKGVEVPFRPARVILQDFTGVPAVVDFAAMRDAVKELGGNPELINPICPVDLVIDHSVQVDFSGAMSRGRGEGQESGGGPGGGTVPRTCGNCGNYGKSNCPAFQSFRPNSPRARRPLVHHHSRPSSPWQPGSTAPQAARSSSPMMYSRPTSPAYPQHSNTLHGAMQISQSPVYLVNQTPGVILSVAGPPSAYMAVSADATLVTYNSTSTASYATLVPATYSVNPSAMYSPLPQPQVAPQQHPGYYTGAPYYSQPPTINNTVISEKLSGLDIEDISLRPMGSRSTRFKNTRRKSEDSRSVGSTMSDMSSSRGSSVSTPSLKMPMSSLPSPQDAPGIPIQDTICPFHREESSWSNALQKNQELEFERNKERFVFLKWGSQALKNMLIVPPGSGIVHQVNLEYLARVVFNENKMLFPDSVVGTDSHTTMINGLGVVGWGVGGIEAEAVMLGQTISMVLPKVVGYKIVGELDFVCTSTDVVLTITKHLRQVGVVGKFVEFFGPGVAQLSLADRATISNMCPEYGATVGFFPVDSTTIAYLENTNRDSGRIQEIEAYLKAVKMFRNFEDASQDPVYSEIVELNLADVVPSVSGPKRPHDRVSVSDMKKDFLSCLGNKVGFKGFGMAPELHAITAPFEYEGQEYTLRNGSVVIAAITSCTNTSNPSVMLAAGLMAKLAVERGLSVKPYIKTSLSPGSGVVTHYLQHSGVTPYLKKLGFDIVGYGCMTCIGNSGPLPEAVQQAIEKNDLVCCGVLSGNRNFEGRIHPSTRANYLASPLLVIAYAIAGRVDIDFEVEPIGIDNDGQQVFLRDIWPTRKLIQEVERASVLPEMFKECYEKITTGNEEWNRLEAPVGVLYSWDASSTYIKRPPFFENMPKDAPGVHNVTKAHVLLNLGDSVTTDHISPAGSIARNSPAARYLASRNLTTREFNSYGSRRGNDDVMARGTFANIRLVNKFVGKAGPRTIHIPSGDELDVFDAAERYRQENKPIIILAGKEYGSGSSRDWAAKGPFLLGVKAVIAMSYERIHRSNLVGMGIIPLQYLDDQSAESLGLTGKELYTINLPSNLVPGMKIAVQVDERTIEVQLRFDTEVELEYFRHGGILNYMIRKMIQ
ncbi:unnamed protein product [Meganyctiphanes norvegica]|uniref:aconitate hydratase n=1 Tax=Meganyctiphanes norvegica TaxID=48144 RepID=A0AAV2QU22_MEGNR